MIALIAALLLLQEKADVDRVRLADAFEQTFRAKGVPERFKAGRYEVQGSIVKDSEIHAFAGRCGPPDGAVLVASTSGTLWALAGGSRGGQGVPVAFFGERAGVLLVGGGMPKGSRPAEALYALHGDHEQRAYCTIGENRMVRIARGDPPADVPTPGGAPAPAPPVEKLAIRGAATLAKDLDELASSWKDASPARRRELALGFADAHRPASGVLACITKEGGLLVMIGADGSDLHPDGMGVEVSGKTRATVVLVPGRAKGSGKPGVARGTGAFIVGP